MPEDTDLGILVDAVETEEVAAVTSQGIEAVDLTVDSEFEAENRLLIRKSMDRCPSREIKKEQSAEYTLDIVKRHCRWWNQQL